MPVFTWMAVPPAKSSEPRARSHPCGAKTQYVAGTYTNRLHRGTNTAHAANFIRLATAPEVSAGVIAANVASKIITAGFIPPKSNPRPKARLKLPINAALPPNASD